MDANSQRSNRRHGKARSNIPATTSTSPKVCIDSANNAYTNHARIRNPAALPANIPKKCPDHPHIQLPEICKYCHELEEEQKAVDDGAAVKHGNASLDIDDLAAEFDQAVEATLAEEKRELEAFSATNTEGEIPTEPIYFNLVDWSGAGAVKQSIDEISPRQVMNEGIVKDTTSNTIDPIHTASDIQSFSDFLNDPGEAEPTMLVHYESEVSDYPDPEEAMVSNNWPYAQVNSGTGATTSYNNTEAIYPNTTSGPYGNTFQPAPIRNNFSPYRLVNRRTHMQKSTAQHISTMHLRPLSTYKPISMRPTVPVNILSSKIILRNTKGPPVVRGGNYSERFALDPDDNRRRRAPKPESNYSERFALDDSDEHPQRRAPAYPNPSRPKVAARKSRPAPPPPAKRSVPPKRTIREVESESEEEEASPKRRVRGRWLNEEFDENDYSPPAKRRKRGERRQPKSPSLSPSPSPSPSPSFSRDDKTGNKKTKLVRPLPTRRMTRSQASTSSPSSSESSTISRGKSPEVIPHPKGKLRSGSSAKQKQKKQTPQPKTSKSKKSVVVISGDEESASESDTIEVNTGKRE